MKSEFKDGVPVGGIIDSVKMFSLIGLLIIIIACINFMNLSTARSEKRAKEVGIRKLSGARKGMLVTQFMMESFIITSFSAMIAIILVQLTLVPFNNLIGIELAIPYSSPELWFSIL